MKKLFSLLVITALLSLSAVAQDDDNESYSRPFRTKVGGAGGIIPIVGMFDNAGIDKFLKAANLPILGSDPMYLTGGEGYGYIMFLKNVRMGGFGVAGSKTVSAIETIPSGGRLKKEVEYGVSYGGFLVDYVVPVAYRIDVAVGATIGGGSIDIRMTRDDGSFKDWDTVWVHYGNVSSSSQNYTRRLKGSFAVFNPHVNIEYTILSWMQLRIGAGYPVMFSPEWKLDENFTIDNVPSAIKTNGYTVNAGIMFGFFGW